MNIIILEGENKTGKSTIARYFTNERHFNYIKCSQPKGDPYVEYYNIIKKLERSPGDYIIDRFYLGELVYGPIYRGKSGLTEQQWISLELKLLSMKAEIIYCYDIVKNIKARFKADHEEFAKDKLIGKTLKAYRNVLGRSMLPITYHQMMTDHDLTLDEGKLLAMSFRDFTQNFKTAVGNTTTPRLILVGERYNEKIFPQYQKFKQPFSFGRSGLFLYSSIHEAKIPFNRVMLINSDSSELKLLKDVGSAIIVALGGKASKVLTSKKLSHVTLNHPSYESRFHHHDSDFSLKLKNIYKNYGHQRSII